MKTLVKILFILCFASISYGQSISKFVLVSKDGNRIPGKDGKLQEFIFEGRNENGEFFTLNLDKIDRLYIADNNKTVIMGFLGLVTGAVLGAALDYDQVQSKFRGNTSLIIGSSTAGTLIGGLVGHNMYNWEVLYPGKMNSLESTASKTGYNLSI